VLLKALGWTSEKITERFGFSEIMMSTLEKDSTAGPDEALLDIYRKLRPGEPPTKESAQTLLENLFFKEKRYDLARVGRYKVNKKLGLNAGKPITSPPRMASAVSGRSSWPVPASFTRSFRSWA